MHKKMWSTLSLGKIICRYLSFLDELALIALITLNIASLNSFRNLFTYWLKMSSHIPVYINRYIMGFSLDGYRKIRLRFYLFNISNSLTFYNIKNPLYLSRFVRIHWSVKSKCSNGTTQVIFCLSSYYLIKLNRRKTIVSKEGRTHLCLQFGVFTFST